MIARDVWRGTKLSSCTSVTYKICCMYKYICFKNFFVKIVKTWRISQAKVPAVFVPSCTMEGLCITGGLLVASSWMFGYHSCISAWRCLCQLHVCVVKTQLLHPRRNAYAREVILMAIFKEITLILPNFISILHK